MTDFIAVKIGAIHDETPLIKRFELIPTQGDLPSFTAGSHVILQMPGGLSRSYSLLNSPRDRNRYELGIALDRNSRGGSRFCHETLKIGDVVSVSRPKNSFSLATSSAPALLIGGGIGVTPLISMAHELADGQRAWKLFYAGRSRTELGFSETLRRFGDRVHLHADDEQGGIPDIPELVRTAPVGTEFYCCGPAPMLSAFASATANIPREHVHTESFTASPTASSGFVVKLAKSNLTFEIPPGTSILEVLRAAGFTAPSSCEQGVCGVCETRVISGIPDHKDMVLSDDEHASNETMMICCSGAKSDLLVLDL